MALLDIIEWVERSPNEIAHKYDMRNNIIKRGSKLTVREGQTAIFCDKGEIADVFGPGMYRLDTDTLPILTALLSWAYAFESPFKSDIYFISTRLFLNQKWGTATPVLIKDKSLGPVRVRGYGTYSFRVSKPAVFLKELSGARSSFVTQDITDHLRSLIVTMLSDALGESGVPALDLSANLVEVGDSVKNSLDKRLASIGVQLGDFRFESVSLPPELEKALDEMLAQYVGEVTCVSFMGGDGDPQRVAQLATYIKEHYKGSFATAWYSGKNDFPEGFEPAAFDYVKIGPYIPERGPLNKETTNQRLYRIKADGTREDITYRFWKR